MASPTKRVLVFDGEAQLLAVRPPVDPPSKRMHEAANSALEGTMAELPSKGRIWDGTLFGLDPIRDSRWAAFVENHRDSSVFHSRGWLQALRDAYGYKFVVVSTCSPEQKLTNGIIFCRVESWLTGRRLVSLPFSDHCEPLIDGTVGVDQLLLHFKRQVHEGQWKYLEIRPILCGPSKNTELSRLVTYHLHRLDLEPTKEQLFKNFHKDCVQRKIRRAEREKLEYEKGASEALLKKFYSLVVMTRRRQNLPPQPLDWFRALIASFGKDLTIRVASKDGVPVASILTLSHKKSVVYKYGCSNAPFNNLGGTALLFWKTIQEAKDCGVEELELGRSDVDNPGLVAFKEHLGATGRLINYWIYAQGSAGQPSVWKKRLARRLFSVAPDFVLETVGKLLYRHVG
jgi:Acetyltransferase (GNAT) domain